MPHLANIAKPRLIQVILFPEIPFCRLDLKRCIFGRFFRCFVDRPLTRLRQRSKLLRFNSRRITVITSFSGSPNCISIAPKGVRSSHAISMIRSISRVLNSFIPIKCFSSSFVFWASRRGPSGCAKRYAIGQLGPLRFGLLRQPADRSPTSWDGLAELASLRITDAQRRQRRQGRLKSFGPKFRLYSFRR